MSSQHSVIEHRANYFFLKIEEDYIDIFPKEDKHRHCKAAILSVIEHWMNSKRTETSQDSDLYIYLSYPQFVKHMFELFSRSTVIKCLQELIIDGIVYSHPYVDSFNQKTFTYMLNVKLINEKLRALAQKPVGSVNINGGSVNLDDPSVNINGGSSKNKLPSSKSKRNIDYIDSNIDSPQTHKEEETNDANASTRASITDLEKWKTDSDKHKAVSLSDSQVDIGNPADLEDTQKRPITRSLTDVPTQALPKLPKGQDTHGTDYSSLTGSSEYLDSVHDSTRESSKPASADAATKGHVNEPPTSSTHARVGRADAGTVRLSGVDQPPIQEGQDINDHGDTVLPDISSGTHSGTGNQLYITGATTKGRVNATTHNSDLPAHSGGSHSDVRDIEHSQRTGEAEAPQALGRLEQTIPTGGTPPAQRSRTLSPTGIPARPGAAQTATIPKRPRYRAAVIEKAQLTLEGGNVKSWYEEIRGAKIRMIDKNIKDCNALAECDGVTLDSLKATIEYLDDLKWVKEHDYAIDLHVLAGDKQLNFENNWPVVKRKLQRPALAMVVNGSPPRDMVEWKGRWMTVDEADELGFNGGFGAYK